MAYNTPIRRTKAILTSLKLQPLFNGSYNKLINYQYFNTEILFRQNINTLKTKTFPITLRVFIYILCFLPISLTGQVEFQLTNTANDFLKSLNSEEIKTCCFAFEDTLRIKWNNLPVGIAPRPGLQYGTLSDTSRIKFHRLLGEVLSSQGYLKITSIMQLDDVLNQLIEEAFIRKMMDEKMVQKLKNLQWGFDNFYIAFWGKPHKAGPWGFSLSGHHLSLNITMIGDKIKMSPLFLGTDPSEVSMGKYAGWRILHEEEDLGFMLLNSLSIEQKAIAVLDKAVPGDIYTSPRTDQKTPTYVGIKGKEMSEAQKTILRLCIQEYVHNYQHTYAHEFMKTLEEKGLDEIYFAWIGSEEKHKPHYYMINGPDFLIEYDNVGFRKDGNHIHLILREKGQDFGENLLQDHYNNSAHH